MGQCLKIREGTFFQKMAESNATFCSTLSILMLDQFKLKVEDDLRCALTNTEPEIQHLVKEKQPHPSH